MKEIIPKHFDYQEVEREIYKYWEENSFFLPRHDEEGEPASGKQTKHQTGNNFVIAVPPPNVTGRLHMGHTLNITIQDALIRYHRMKGDDALWVPGTDHAGIATQTVVKKRLDSQGIDYREIGREEFIKNIWEWKDKYGEIILDQIKSLGASCDWSRVRFTMDKKLVKAVNYSFKKLYDDGLIYRGERIVNWCPVDQTALSDDEVETNPDGEPGYLYDLAYPVVGSDESLIVSTTRPETMFGDVALAVHPEDERYQKYLGKKVLLPLMKREIPIIADEYVKKDFGTGCLKITPAHDPNDFQIGERHNLTPINVMEKNATMNDLVPAQFRGLTREDCRVKIIDVLDGLGLYQGRQERNIPLGRSYRSKEVIEYRLSKQWFVRTKPLAEKLLARSNELNIYPANLRKLWNYWLENINDWCISRQIWWGHRIPVWYHRESGEVLVSETTPEQVLENPDVWRQEEDVLDTWYSSALWPMSILGWPDKTADFNNYFPTTTLSTAKDIIFFWVARMGLMSIYFEDKLPFKNVYFHATVMDHRGKTMSKSKGNGIDPQHIINGASIKELKNIVLEAHPSNQEELLREIDQNYHEGFQGVGADALRFTLIYLSSNQQYLQVAIKNFTEIGRRFTTKLWNAARMVLGVLNDQSDGIDFSSNNKELLEAQWFETSLQKAHEQFIKAFESMDFTNLGNTCYHLCWNDFCDWYLEVSKRRINQSKNDPAWVVQFANHFVKLITLLHPLIPFITEEIYQKLKKLSIEKNFKNFVEPDSALITNPHVETTILPETSFNSFSLLQEAVSAIRSFKVQEELTKKDAVKAYYQVENEDVARLFQEETNLIKELSKVDSFQPTENFSGEISNFQIVTGSYSIYLDYQATTIIVPSNDAKVEQLQKDIDFINKRLSNPGFVNHAKPEVVDKERVRLQELQSTLNRLLKI